MVNRRKTNRRLRTKKVNAVSSLFAFVIIALVVICIMFLIKGINKDIVVYDEEINKKNDDLVVDIEPQEHTITIAAGGDLLIHDTVFNSAKKTDGTYDFTPMFSEIKDFFEKADLGIINLEVPVAGNIYSPSNYPNFNSPVELLDGVKYMGVDIVSTANNHALDKGLTGLNETIKNATLKGLTVVGTYQTEDTKPVIVEKNGINIGIAAYTYGTNGIAIPSSAPYCVNIIDKEKILKDINYLRENNADFIVFYMHFGQEYKTSQNATQEDLVSFLVENGVDIIFGSHPHVPQPYKVIESTDDNGVARKTFVVYSLGNFISNQTDYYTKLGGIAKITLSKEGEEKSIVDYEIVPIYTYIKTVSGKRTFKVVPLEKAIYEYDNNITETYSEEETTTFKKLLKDASSIYELNYTN